MCLGLLGFTKMCLGSGRVGLNGLGSGQISGRVLTRPIPTNFFSVGLEEEFIFLKSTVLQHFIKITFMIMHHTWW